MKAQRASSTRSIFYHVKQPYLRVEWRIDLTRRYRPHKNVILELWLQKKEKQINDSRKTIRKILYGDRCAERKRKRERSFVKAMCQRYRAFMT